MTKEETAKLADLLRSIHEARRLFSKRILKESEYHDLNTKIHDTLKEVLMSNSDLQREYDVERRRTVWRKLDSNGYATDIGRVEFWENFINRVLQETGSSPAPEQLVIQAGEHFTARTAVRDILSQANSSIAIFDEYLDDAEVLNIVEPYAIKGIDIAFLKNDPRRAFVSDVAAFAKQYSHVELRSHTTGCHDRFIILDDSVVYQLGHSLKDLGSKVTVINKLDETGAKKYLGLFSGWWTAARVLI